jgi:hypothetical protein
MFELFLPILTLHIYQWYQKSEEMRFWQSLMIVSSWIILYDLISPPKPLAIILWILTSFTHLFSSMIRHELKIPFSIEMIRFLRSPKSFLDSAKELKLFTYLCIAFGLIALSLPAFRSPPELSFWVPLFIFSVFQEIFSKMKVKQARKKISDLPTFPFRHEIALPLSTKYPALRKTQAFLGEKKINIPLLTNEKPHIIFLFLESFRAKNIGCLGAKIPASPHFDRWSEKGFLFSNFHTNGLQTFRAIISAYFGIPAHLPTIHLKPFCSVPMRGLPQILKEKGYHPAIIQSGELSFDYLYPFFKSHGFETLFGKENIPYTKKPFTSWGIDDMEMLDFAADFLENQKDPTFLSLFTINNHHPWKHPPGWNFPIPQNLPHPYPDFLQTFAYTDHCLNAFLNKLKEKNLLEKSILFIMGDHGQEMGEKRPFSPFNQSLSQENIHIPLLILAEGRKISPQRLDDAASLIDLPPTVMDLLNLEAVHHSLGHSLLRKIASPVYFSLNLQNTEIGSIIDFKKTIISSEETLGFDLSLDPEEIHNTKQISHDTVRFFNDIEILWKEKAWTNKSTEFQIKTEANITDEQFLKSVLEKPDASIIDLSFSLQISDLAILRIPKTRLENVHHLNLSHNTRITDLSLQHIARDCKNLMILNLSYCHLISNEGVHAILATNSNLRHLWLDGIEDLSDFVPKNQTFHLQTLSLKEIDKLTNDSILHLFENSPNLTHWSADFSQMTNETLIKISRLKKHCIHMHITNGIAIDDEPFSELLASQIDLQEVHIDRFQKLKNPDFSSLNQLRYLEISNCSELTDCFFESIKNIPLLRLKIQNCKKITKEAILHFQAKNIPPLIFTDL